MCVGTLSSGAGAVCCGRCYGSKYPVRTAHGNFVLEKKNVPGLSLIRKNAVVSEPIIVNQAVHVRSLSFMLFRSFATSTESLLLSMGEIEG